MACSRCMVLMRRAMPQGPPNSVAEMNTGRDAALRAKKEDCAIAVLFTAPRYHTNQHFAVKALLDAGHKVAFFALRRGTSEEYSALTPLVLGHSRVFECVSRILRRAEVDSFVLRFAFPPVGRFWREVRKFRPSVVIIRDPNTAYGFLSLLVAKAVRAKVIFYTQGPKYRNTGRLDCLVRSLLLKILRAEWITPVLGQRGPGARTVSRMHYVPFVIEPGIPPEKKRWFKGGMINIMTVGKFQPRKNHVLLLEAVKELRAVFPVRLTIIGEASRPAHLEELRRVENSIARLGLSDIVKVYINLPFRSVQELYAVHDVFVLPSRDEPAAVSILEAMAHGLPVLCSDSVGTKCYIEEGQNGLVFQTDNLEDLVEKLRFIVEDRTRLVSMGRRSYELVVERHDPRIYVQAIQKLCKRK